MYPDATDADKQISLMETMLKFKYHLFKTICSQLQFGGGPLSGIEPSDDLQCALNTPIDIDEEIGGQQFKFQTNTSPILPLGHRSATDAEHPMSYLQDPSDISIDYKPDPDYQPDVITLKLDKVMWNTKELMDLINEKISIKTGGQSPYDGLSFGKDND
ncbi:hypothetical protein FACS1894166_08890 [Bacilli bacterium]|nr:hypothetical protein FACS1894166_08890 [Bacilli bacterium]